MAFFIIFIAILALILLIAWGKLYPFLAFMIVSIGAGLALGLPFNKVVGSVEHGIGDILGSLVIILALGAMLGKIVANSGAALKISSVLVKTFGRKYMHWALMITGFVIGISLFYGVGFVLVIPLIFSLAYQYRLPAIATGLPMLAALSVTHGFLPPHPSPTALVAQFNANMGVTLVYGMIVSVPAIIIAGPVFARTLRKIPSTPLPAFIPKVDMDKPLPGTANSFFTSLFPVMLLIIATVITFMLPANHPFLPFLSFAGNASTVMIIAVMLAAFSLGTSQGRPMKDVMELYGEAVKDIASILLIIAGAGALKQVMSDSGVSTLIAGALQSWNFHPLVMGWIIAAILRVCLGSATIAGLTTAGIIAPLLKTTNVDPNLMVLSVGAGSLFFSHVNDTGFWMFKEYFNISMKDTFRSWTIMETIISITGLISVLILQAVL
jgi:Gnt-I system high-affinity gluconate transporter